MKRKFTVRQSWIIEVEPPEGEGHMMETIARMLDVPTPVRILAGFGIPAAQIHTEAEFEETRTCRTCGCTDLDCSQCIAATGEPCHWAEEETRRQT